MDFKHISVMLDECIEGLNIKPDGIYLDGTAGGAGHSSEIAKRLTSGRLIALDQDPDAIQIATERLSEYKTAQVVSANFRDMDSVLQELQIDGIDGILLDLGVSSHQLDVTERGFSYHGDAPLDMRMSQKGISAKDIVNTYSVNELTRILREYGEENFARKIAFSIEKARAIKPIETTAELAELVKSSIPAAKRREKNPCKKTFQAIRIAVNGELDSLSEGLDKAFSCLNPGGRLVIITFHSLEDRMVKHRYLEWCKGCTCPPDFPVCVCGNQPKARLVNRKPIVATEEELEYNRRSKSAKLRILEKL
ncbi:16S rRNA (cytosine(1402)-N(4))-methyltransferase RsmH [Paludicola sp. MB14-C6]|uniref:16S rRNA (cytosine(1402)-N(4))-methyltransferase RsmH n=1 Tax=Paludihabitans sp. MB14-C6 TaxID=3070656 RepID=UPI0027DB73CE|nr:16S rRNA (cytosine(1402)-N(4))-methyltransferase RsmH [Paludicola sp. MB14-C6]WMJ23767.1 16S rRNA (cytosine(1402)-N(4))-methyltransferase RsmH [Paludicola sp. MB14-C6]